MGSNLVFYCKYVKISTSELKFNSYTFPTVLLRKITGSHPFLFGHLSSISLIKLLATFEKESLIKRKISSSFVFTTVII